MDRADAEDRCDVAVIGAGPTGLAAALALAGLGIGVALCAPAFDVAAARPDPRTTAVLGGSLDLLENLGVMPGIGTRAAALAGIRLIDAMGGLVRAPEVVFRATELGRTAFGANIANTDLVAGLGRVAAGLPGLRWLATAVRGIEMGEAGVRLLLADGQRLAARLVVAADGRNSIGRQAAGIGVRQWTYPQAALVTVFGHGRPHGAISTEFHRPGGPLTTVPMPDDAIGPRSSLVWVEPPETAARLAALAAGAFAQALETALQGLLGRIGMVGPRATFALTGMTADALAAQRIVLVGEAAHVIPPIGAQGLNLGLRDAATVADVVADAIERGDDVGGARVLADYAARRGADIGARTFAVDLLNRSLIHDILPLQAARGIGLFALAAVPALKRMAMQRGLEPVGQRPRLMRPGAVSARRVAGAG